MIKKNRLYAILFLLSAVIFFGCATTNPNLSSSKSSALFLEAQKDFEAGRSDSAEVKIRELIKASPNSACAYNLLGEIYRKEGGLENRITSARKIRKAIELEPLNPVYHYNLGLTCLDQDFKDYAIEEFKKAIDLDSNYIQPWIAMGDAHKQHAIIYDEGRYYNRATTCYKRALRTDSLNGEALYDLAVVFCQKKNYDEAKLILEKIKEGSFDSTRVFLLYAYLQHRMKNYRQADKYFEKGLDLTSAEERNIYEDIELLLSGEQKKEHNQLDEEGKLKFRQKFWTSIDPDPSTEINERKLEHYSRIVYSDINFSLPVPNVRGALSDRGKTCIKFGEPDFKQYEMGDFLDRGMVPSKWHWFYNNQGKSFSLTFENAFQNYNFVIPYEENFTSFTIQSLSATTPQLYDFDYGGELLKCLYQIYQFKGKEGKTNLDVVYAIPNSELKFASFDKLSQAIIEEKYIATNLDGQKVREEASKKGFLVSTSHIADSNLLVTNLFSFDLPAGDYQLAWSIRDSSSKKIAVLKLPLEVDNFSLDSLGLSSIILADKISPDTKEDFVRQGYSIFPNFNHTFYAREKLKIYFETYNLKKDWEGKTYYQSECTVSSLKKGRKGEAKRTKIVSQSLKNRGINTDELENFSLSLMDAQTGEYELTIKIADLNSGISKERICRFRLIGKK